MICAYYRWLISSALDGATPPGRMLRRHLRRCQSCREFHDRSVRLGRALREEPVGAGARLNVRSGYEAEVLRRRVVTAALAVALLLVAVATLIPDGPNVTGVTSGTTDPTYAVSAPRVVKVPSTDELVAAVRGSVADIAEPVGGPVAREIEEIHGRFVRARDALLAYLPAEPLEPSEQPESTM